MLARFVGDLCSALWLFLAVCLIRGVVTVANFIDVFDGVVTVATGVTAFAGDLLLLAAVPAFVPLPAFVGELNTNFNGGTTPSLQPLFFSTGGDCGSTLAG